jgi:hypothetical protein
LAEIDGDIRKISELTSIKAEVEPLRVNRSRKLRSGLLQNVRDNAQSLFDLLHLRWSRACPCDLPHRANLQLRMQQDEEKNDFYDDDTATSFELLFSFEKSIGISKPFPWDWRNVKVETSPLAPEEPGSLMGVKIQQPVLIAPRPKRPPRIVPPQSSKIDNLCQVLVLGGSQNCCLGFLDDKQRRHHLFSVPSPGIQKEISDETSLHSIVHGNNKLGPRERYSFRTGLIQRTANLSTDAPLPYFLPMQSWSSMILLGFPIRGT